MSRGDRHKPPPKILVVRVGAMGDILHALPALFALRLAVPEAEIGWVIDERWRALLEGGGVVDHLHAVPMRTWKARPLAAETRRGVLGLRAELRARS